MTIDGADRTLRTSAGIVVPGKYAFMRDLDIHKDMPNWPWMKGWLFAVTGRQFSDAEVRLVEGIWLYTSYPDVRLWNNRVAAFAASARSTPSLGLAAGISSSEAYVFGRQPDFQAVSFIQRVVSRAATGVELEGLIDEELATFGRVAGYGRPLNSEDERMAPLKALARSLDLAEGPHERAVAEVGALLQRRKKRLAPNYAALASAFGADLGLSPREYVAVVSLCFVAGMVLFWVTAPEPGIAQVPAAPHAAETTIGG